MLLFSKEKTNSFLNPLAAFNNLFDFIFKSKINTGERNKMPTNPAMCFTFFKKLQKLFNSTKYLLEEFSAGTLITIVITIQI